MMVWSEDPDETAPHTNVIDAVFFIEGKTLPIHALSAFSQSLSEQIENWDKVPNIALHLNLGSEEGNGWYRETNPNSVLYLSRRSKLILRAEVSVLTEIQFTHGFELDVRGHKIKLRHKHNKILRPFSTLYSQHVISDFPDELDFLNKIQTELRHNDVYCKKVLCGKSRQLTLGQDQVITRSLMLNELNKEESIRLQASGIGSEQKRGCGIFIPYKSIS